MDVTPWRSYILVSLDTRQVCTHTREFSFFLFVLLKKKRISSRAYWPRAHVGHMYTTKKTSSSKMPSNTHTMHVKLCSG